MGVLCLALEESLQPAIERVFYAWKMVQNIKRSGGCKYWSFGLHFCKAIYTYLTISNVR